MSLDAYPRIADWLTVEADTLVVHTGKVDIGQRISTALAQIAHEELTLPLNRIDIAPVRTGHAPNEGVTSGSNSIEQSGHSLRRAAASLRRSAIAVAVARFGGAEADWTLEDGVLNLPGTNHRLDILSLAEAIPPDAEVDKSAPSLGRADASLPRPDMRGIRQMVQGRYTYVQDLDRPNMLHARVVRPPHARARLRDVRHQALENAEAAGLTVVRDGSFLAVAGPSEWQAIKSAQSLSAACDWDRADGLPEADVFVLLNAEKAQRFLVVNGTPTDRPIPDLRMEPTHTARYERPYQLHGSLAPAAAMAEWSGDTLRIHTQSQGIYPLRTSIADILGLAEEQVDITHVPGSGCYGHTGADDAAFEAALVAIAIPDRPILLKWTREDEHKWEPFASAMAVDMSAVLQGGRIARFSAEVFSDTHRGRPRPGPDRAGPARLLANRFRADPIGPVPAQPTMGRHAGMHRNLDPIYDVGERRLVKNLVPGLPHRTSAMRCLGGAANIFALESFMDELARSLDVAPIEFRLRHLDHPRDRAVLKVLSQTIDTRPALSEGQGRGIAFAQYKNQMTRVGVCAEVDVNDRAEVSLLHAEIVADAGRVIDADGLTAQLEGGFIQAASWALCEEVTWDRDGITSCDWDSYPVIRFDNIPTIGVTLLDRAGAPSVGAGEAAPGPAVAAIANAIFDATGIRLRRLPFTPQSLLQQALNAE